jgi:4-diphosphocytidyl-2-C-methyl-D-erythritol kinase
MTIASGALIVPAPAKINLFLHVTGRRADGYHTLESLLALVDWCDTVELVRRDDGAIVRSRDVPGVPESDDLTLAAARALRDATGTRQGVAIAIDKRIPQGAGLGGGSSDAASVLLALNRLWELRLPRSELAAIGVALGADVPFFVGGSPAIARGIGESLTSVSMPGFWVTLAIPAVHVATREIFAALQLTRDVTSEKMSVFSESYGRNDLEAVTSVRFPEVARSVAVLRRASPAARMTGSGACAFAAFADEGAAQSALVTLPRDVAGRVVRTLARHPLAAFA